MTLLPPATARTNDWWFCTPPAREEIRFHTSTRDGQTLGVILSCSHGTWDNLRSARIAHGYTVDAVTSELT